MASEFETRKRELLAECEVDEKLFAWVLPRRKNR